MPRMFFYQPRHDRTLAKSNSIPYIPPSPVNPKQTEPPRGTVVGIFSWQSDPTCTSVAPV